MNCRDIQSKLASYVDGQLSADEHRMVRGHLRGCPSCRAALTEIDPVAAMFLRSDTPAVPGRLTAEIMAAAHDRIRPEPTAGWNPVAWLRLASVPIRAAAAVMLLVGITLGLKLGASATPSHNQVSISQDDPLDIYQISYIADFPDGSLAGSYLSLIEFANKGGE